MAVSDSRLTGAIEIVVAPEMIRAGMAELAEHKFADDWKYVLISVYRGLAYASRSASSTNFDR